MALIAPSRKTVFLAINPFVPNDIRCVKSKQCLRAYLLLLSPLELTKKQTTYFTRRAINLRRGWFILPVMSVVNCKTQIFSYKGSSSRKEKLALLGNICL